ncbi:MAG: hypothetical protein GXY23_12005 [Myxococcales bacterium]|nr:hypothetical protein [Myxococcales bacterium]
MGTFSTIENAPSCTPWTECQGGEVVGVPGTETSDRACVAEWVRQFGTAGLDFAEAVAIDANGHIVVAGVVSGGLSDEPALGERDAFVRKLDREGNVLWTRQFGTSARERVFDVAVDPAGSIYVGGSTEGTFPGETSSGGEDGFVRKYDADGNALWTRQLGTAGADRVTALEVDSAGDLVVVGWVRNALAGQTSLGWQDAFVRKYDAAGNALWTVQFGTNESDYAYGVALDDEDAIYVIGETWGEFAGQTAAGFADAFVQKLDAQGNALWVRQFGTDDSDYATAVVADPEDGAVVVVGETFGTFGGGPYLDYADGFVRRLDAAGNTLWTTQFGGYDDEYVYAVAVDAAGDVVIGGSTYDVFPGEDGAGGADAYLLRFDRTGAVVGLRQFGTDDDDAVYAVVVDDQGDLVVVGDTAGTFAGQTSSGDVDAFVAKLASP